MGFPGGAVVKNPPPRSGDSGLTSASGRSPAEEMANHSGVLAWEIPWIEEPDGLHPWGHKRVAHDLATRTTTRSVTVLLPKSHQQG